MSPESYYGNISFTSFDLCYCFLKTGEKKLFLSLLKDVIVGVYKKSTSRYKSGKQQEAAKGPEGAYWDL